MKKLLLAVIAAGLMSTSVLAMDGVVSKIVVTSTTVKIGILSGGSTYAKLVDVETAVGRAMLATALTAKTTQKPVAAFHDGTSWNYIEVTE